MFKKSSLLRLHEVKRNPDYKPIAYMLHRPSYCSVFLQYVVIPSLPYHGLNIREMLYLIFSICFCVGSCRGNSWLCIGSTDGLYVIDLAASELQTAIYFTGRMCKNKHLLSHKGRYLTLKDCGPVVWSMTKSVVLLYSVYSNCIFR